jgi:hypothetical protein
MIMVLIRYFGLGGIALLFWSLSQQNQDDAAKSLFRALPIGFAVAWVVVVLYLVL